MSGEGTITTFAGTGVAGTSGDGDAAVDAELEDPDGLFFHDLALYITDSFAHTLRRVNAAGAIELLAGTPGQAGSGGDGGPALSARLNFPKAVAVVGTDLLISDRINDSIRLVRNDSIFTIVGGTTGFAGDGDVASLALISSPAGLFVASDGRIIFADLGNNRVRVLNP